MRGFRSVLFALRLRASILSILFVVATAAPALATPPVSNGNIILATTPMVDARYYGVKCNGSNDDTSAAQSALSAAGQLSASKGATQVLFPGGTCQFSTTLTNTNPNVIIVGVGGDNGHDTGTNCTSSSIFKWIGSTSSPIVQIAPTPGAAAQNLYGSGVRNVCFTSNTTHKASHAVVGESVNHGVFSHLFADDTFSGSKFYFGTVSQLGEYTDLQHNEISLACQGKDDSQDCMYLDGGGTPAGNVSMNVIEVAGDYFNGNLVTCNNADNNVFINVQGYLVGAGTGYGADLKANCYSNLFMRFTPGGPWLAETGSTQNTVLVLDSANGSPAPTVQSGASIQYTTSNGDHFNFRYENMAVGANTYEAGQALSRRDANASLYVYNGSQDHIKLDDGTQTASITIGPNHNLNFNASSGTVKSNNTFFASTGTSIAYQIQSNLGGQTVSANSNGFAGGNFSNGDAETDFFNTNNAPANTTTAFRFYGFQNGATTGTLLQSLYRNGNVSFLGSVVGGSSTSSSSCAAGDGCFSRSTTSGAVNIGGSSSSCTFDFGVTVTSGATLPCLLNPTSGLEHLAVGSNVSETANAVSRIAGTETLHLYNGSSNHMKLDDGTCQFAVNLDSSHNLRFGAGSGCGQVNLAGAQLIGAAHQNCGATSGLPCGTTLMCALSSAASCTGNITVPPNAICTATPNASDTTSTSALERLIWGTLSVNTQPFTVYVGTSQTATASFSVSCV